MKSFKGFLMIALLAVACVSFGQTPTMYPVTLTESATAGHTTEWSVPAWNAGALLTIQNVGDDAASTLAVKHVVKISETVSVTNTVETALAYTATVNYPLALLPTQYYSTTNGVVLTYSPPAPRYLSYGDKLLFTYNATNYSGKAIIWMNTSK
jgi:hypothetical protein